MKKELSNSYSIISNIQFGSTELGVFWENCQSCLIPNIALSHPEVGGRAGARIKMQSDTVVYSPLIIDVVLDKDWKVYDEIYAKFLKDLNVEQGTFSSDPFDVWLSLMDKDGKEVRKFWFYDCRLTDISEITVSTFDDEDQILTCTLTFDFTYLEYSGYSFKDAALD